jgi:hypothetical protein
MPNAVCDVDHSFCNEGGEGAIGVTRLGRSRSAPATKSFCRDDLISDALNADKAKARTPQPQ